AVGNGVVSGCAGLPGCQIQFVVKGWAVAACASRNWGDRLLDQCEETEGGNKDVVQTTLEQLPGEKLELTRKVGEAPQQNPIFRMVMLDFFMSISHQLREIRERLDKNVSQRENMEEWKYAAMALDRLCLVMFGILLFACVFVVFFVHPNYNLISLP
ncbi:hypothetical protein COOONC_19125, partial [Cooperia oncophora]